MRRKWIIERNPDRIPTNWELNVAGQQNNHRAELKKPSKDHESSVIEHFFSDPRLRISLGIAMMIYATANGSRLIRIVFVSS